MPLSLAIPGGTTWDIQRGSRGIIGGFEQIVPPESMGITVFCFRFLREGGGEGGKFL
jgi:hypothetical protein